MDLRAAVLPHRGMHRSGNRFIETHHQPMKTTVYITREVEITVEARYIPGTAATRWEPCDPDDIIIDEAYDDTGGVMLTEAEREEVRMMILENPPERDCDCD